MGHSPEVRPKIDKNKRPGSNYACYVQKQVIIFFFIEVHDAIGRINRWLRWRIRRENSEAKGARKVETGGLINKKGYLH